eukprot:TRINITY_DN1040_c0_g1_i12.p1 TRINITY_DN1040_c0_g1~~TRINITY_DN1040_c0_g1_i12.p1  ORF type:complete len:667 (-),score=69.15 TRINITY_DN1040_c0_g1_i12:245-2245(-)
MECCASTSVLQTELPSKQGVPSDNIPIHENEGVQTPDQVMLSRAAEEDRGEALTANDESQETAPSYPLPNRAAPPDDEPDPTHDQRRTTGLSSATEVCDVDSRPNAPRQVDNHRQETAGISSTAELEDLGGISRSVDATGAHLATSSLDSPLSPAPVANELTLDDLGIPLLTLILERATVMSVPEVDAKGFPKRQSGNLGDLALVSKEWRDITSEFVTSLLIQAEGEPPVSPAIMASGLRRFTNAKEVGTYNGALFPAALLQPPFKLEKLCIIAEDCEGIAGNFTLPYLRELTLLWLSDKICELPWLLPLTCPALQKLTLCSSKYGPGELGGLGRGFLDLVTNSPHLSKLHLSGAQADVLATYLDEHLLASGEPSTSVTELSIRSWEWDGLDGPCLARAFPRVNTLFVVLHHGVHEIACFREIQALEVSLRCQENPEIVTIAKTWSRLRKLRMVGARSREMARSLHTAKSLAVLERECPELESLFLEEVFDVWSGGSEATALGFVENDCVFRALLHLWLDAATLSLTDMLALGNCERFPLLLVVNLPKAILPFEGVTGLVQSGKQLRELGFYNNSWNPEDVFAPGYEALMKGWAAREGGGEVLKVDEWWDDEREYCCHEWDFEGPEQRARVRRQFEEMRGEMAEKGVKVLTPDEFAMLTHPLFQVI